MGDVYERGEKIDRITVANELMKFGELESCDGLSYLVSLDDGLPQIPNVDAYIRLVKDKATLRSIIFASEHMRNRAMMAEESPDAILAGPRRPCSNWVRRRSRAACSIPTRSCRVTTVGSAPSWTPASASVGSPPGSPSWMK